MSLCRSSRAVQAGRPGVAYMRLLLYPQIDNIQRYVSCPAGQGIPSEFGGKGAVEDGNEMVQKCADSPIRLVNVCRRRQAV